MTNGSRCSRERMRERMLSGADVGADTTLANLIGLHKSHDLESAPASTPASALVPCDLS